jgi:peptide/nickel transport system permease protein
MSTFSNSDSADKNRIWRDAFSNFPLILGLIIVLGIVVIVLFGPLFSPYNPYLVDRVVREHYDFETEIYTRLPVHPNDDFVFGTNEIGQDMLSLVLHGARNTLIATVLIASARVLIGLFIGLIAGWYEGKWFDRLFQASLGVLTSLPVLISGLIFIFALGIRRGMITFFIALTLVGWTEVAQYIRGEVLVARRMPYMEAARSIGLREVEIAIRHVIPNVIPQLFVIAFLEMGAVLMLLGELALIGVFIGGGATLDFSELMSPPTIVAIPSRPEWGAMIASGFRWFRPAPHIVLIPAAAVFISVVGFNLLGEGLRGLFERRGINVSFILSRRMLFVIASFFAITVLIFQGTQPTRWFKALATDFNAENVLFDQDLIPQFAAQTTGIDRPVPIAEYIAVEMDGYGGKGGIRFSDYFEVRHAFVYEPAWTPVLEVVSANGDRQIAFEYGRDFGYVIDQYGGAGQLSLPLTLVHFYPDLRENARVLALNVSAQDRIVMLQEGNAPSDVVSTLINRGVAGIIWVAQPEVAIQDARTKSVPEDGPYSEPVGVPTFRITYQAAQQILASQNINIDEVFSNQRAQESDLAREITETDIELKMQLGLKSKKPLEINNVVAYYQGTDADLGDEIIVFAIACDGLWRSTVEIEQPIAYQPNQCPAGFVIELMRMLNDHVIDLKRPVMMVLWGGAEFSHLGLSEWISSRDSFAHLSAPGMQLQPRPSIFLEISTAPNSNTIQFQDRSADSELRELFMESFAWADVQVQEVEHQIGLPFWVSNEFLEFQASFSLNYDQPNLQQFGEAFSLAFVRMLREPILNTD